MVTPGGAGQARTRLARAAVIGAARELFVVRGYGATTVDAISELAGVPAPTVYRLFSSKRGILKHLLDVSIAGDDVEVPLAARPSVQALLDHEDPGRQLEGLVQVATQINLRVAPLYRVLIGAASADPEAASLLDEVTGQRHRGQRRVARRLARSGALRPELRERDAADVIHALVSPEVFQLLVLDRRWPAERYTRWLTETLTHQLLRPPSSSRDR